MFDEICSEIRDIIHDTIVCSIEGIEFEEFLEERGLSSPCIQLVDDGLALAIGEDLYSISIQKV